LEAPLSPEGEETFDDRPQWIDHKNNRIRVCQHFFIEKGVWKLAYFTETRFLIEPMDREKSLRVKAPL